MVIYHSTIPRSQGGDFYETIAINVPIADTLSIVANCGSTDQ